MRRLSPLWSVTAFALCGGALAGPEVTPNERVLALGGILIVAWFAPARGAWMVAALALGLVGAGRQHAILRSAAPWEGPARVARAEVLRRLGDDRAEVWLGSPGIAAVRAVLRGVPPDAAAGTRAIVRLEAGVPVSFRNPDDRNRRRETLRYGAVLRGRVLQWETTSASTKPESPRERLRGRAQAWLGRHLRGTAPLWQALLLGDRGDLPESVQERFRRLGLSHLLALSGLHVGLVAAAVLALQRRRRPTRTALVVVAAWSTLAGWSPSLARAVAMLAWWWVARAVKRGGSASDALAAAALMEWWIAPWRTAGLGWWLSYVATGAIVAAAPWLARRSKLVTMLGVSIAAQLATLPWLAGAFGQIPWFAPVALLVVGPAFALLMSGGMALVLLGSIVPVLQPAAAAWVQLLTHAFGALLVLVDSLSPEPWGHPGIGGWAWGVGLASSLCLVAPLGWSMRHRLGLWAVLVALAHVSLLVPSRLTWVSLDIGQGDAGVLRSRRGWLVVDTGPAFEGWSAARRVVLPYLERRNARDVVLALTHGHLDHTGEAAALLESGRIGRLVLAAADSTSKWTRPLRETAGAGAIDVVWLRRGDVLEVGSQRLRCLWPPADSVSHHANDRSLVLATVPGRELLLTGDLEWGGEGHLLDLAPVTVLKVAHHGGNTGTGADLLAQIRPRWGLISCGRGNRYGHPSPATLERLGAASVQVLRTDQCGAVRVRWDEDRCRILTARAPP